MKLIQQAFMTAALLSGAYAGQAQYYYNDIVANKDLLTEMSRLKEQKVHTINVMSFEGGMPVEDFFCQKKINRSYTESVLKTSTGTSYANYFTSVFSKDGLLEKTVDSSEVSATTAYYTYNGNQQLVKITSATDFSDDDYPDKGAEEHIYQYDAKGMLSKMLLVKNVDTTVILFMPDESNNISIEKNTKTGDIYYYYYDLKNRLTDVVHTYNLQNKLIPDYKFEYNSQGLLTQMVASEKEGAYYFTWKYSYENGLRTMERCYSKEGRLSGSVEYEYK